MELTDCKIKNEDYENMDIASLSDRPSADGMSAQTLKERFDASTKHIVQPKFNQLIDLLTSTEGADNIGITPIEGVAGYTVQQILAAVKLLLDDKQSIEQSNKDVDKKFDKTEAQALVREVTFSESSGVFTITKYDGSVKTIDTAIEKVALDVRLDGQQFVLTLVDGTEQRVDLSAFITQTEVKNSDTITLAIESGVIVARLASGSITMAHLNPEVTAYIEAKEQSAANSAASASVSEQNALNSANSAEQSYQNAKACQEQSCLCATQAELSRQAAATSESNASSSEKVAKEAQERAEQAAQQAETIAGGDFVTNTAFNQFKETVPTLDDGKVSVQQGGLYINSDTTEKDKEEAQKALANLGALLADGSAPMTNRLIINGDSYDGVMVKNKGNTVESKFAQGAENNTFVSVYKDDNNETAIGLKVLEEGMDTSQVLQLYVASVGDFGIYGDHNHPKPKAVDGLTADINVIKDCNTPPALINWLNTWDGNLLNKPVNNKVCLLLSNWSYGGNVGNGVPTATQMQTTITEDGRVLTRHNDGGGVFTEWKEAYLPLDGSVSMSGDFKMTKDYPELRLENTHCDRSVIMQGYDDYVEFGDFIDSSNHRLLRIKPASVDITNGVSIAEVNAGLVENYNIFHEGSKPTGIYTGNGSTTAREINIGGMNDGVRFLLVESANGVVIVTRGIAVGINSSGTAKKISGVTVSKNMVLTIASSDTLINGNSVTYNYHLV